MAVKGLEKEAPFCFCTKGRCGLLEALPATQLNSFNSPVQVDNLPCVRAHPAGRLHVAWNTWPEGRGCESLDGKRSLLTLGGHCIVVLNLQGAPWGGAGEGEKPRAERAWALTWDWPQT